MKTVTNFVRTEKRLFTDSVRSFLPSYALVPFNLTKKKDFKCIVQQDDVVKEGQVIALSSKEENEKRIYIHSPIPGKVAGFENCCLPDGGVGIAVKIKMEGSFSYLGKILPETDWQWFSKENLLDIFTAKGVTNTFNCGENKAELLARQIENCKLTRNKFLIVRFFDEDPSRVTDSFVAEKCLYQVLKGALITARAMEANGIIFVLPQKSPIKINENDFSGIPILIIEAANNRYPAGFKQNLIDLIKRNSHETNLSDFTGVNRNCIFCDPEAMLAAYEAVALGKPAIESYIHITGECLKSAAMFKVRLGTTIRSLVNQCGGFKIKPVKVIINGMLKGTASTTLDTVITKQVKSITLISEKDLSVQIFSPCIRCGKCRSICPAGLFPDLMFRHRLGGKPVGEDLVKTANLCSGCSLCNSVCPSRLPLSQTIELLRKSKDDI